MNHNLKLFLQGVGSILNIWGEELPEYKYFTKKINSNKNKTDSELLKSDWEQIGKDFDKIILR